MKDLYVRGLDESLHLQLEAIAKEKSISKNELVIIIIKRALIENELDEINRLIKNHINEHNNTVNRLIDVNADIVKELNNLSNVIKHYMG